VYRNGSLIGIAPTNSYSDTGLAAATSYTYTVSAYDAAGNNSAQSSGVSATTESVSNPTGPAGYTFCANENGTCSFSGTMSVAFGAGTSFNYLTLTNGTACNDTVFGDPDYGVVKACFTKAVDTTPPTTSITAPANNATVSGSVTITAAASDNVGVTQVQFYIDGSLVGTDIAAPYTYAWNSATATNGTHTLSTKAYDAAGNIGTSPNVTVTVSNAVVIPFKITNIAVTPSSTSATMTITTNEAASIRMQYGPTTSYGNTTAASPNLSTIYENLTGLAANTTYDYRFLSIPQGATTTITSQNYTFTTSGVTSGSSKITSSLSATATVGSPFSYQITGTNSPQAYYISGLPSGLSSNSAYGTISGTPTTAGTYPVTIGITNAGGFVQATLTLTVN
jgi:hypothetical protein